MQINILHRPGASIAQCVMEQGETPLRAEAGAMVGQSMNIYMETSSGGLLKGMKSMLGGESFFTNKFTSTGGTGEVLLGGALPGDMAILDCTATRNWRIARGAFVACEDQINIETKFGGLSAMFSGTGLAHLEANGEGQVVVAAFGAIERIPVDGKFVIDNGHIVAWTDGLSYKVTKAGGGFVSAFLSGEGMVCTFSGQGELLMQTRNAVGFAQFIGSRMPPV